MSVDDLKNLSENPINLDDLKKIEATNLSAFDQHHLRLLVHCLELFKTIANGSLKGALPLEKDRLQWCLDQPSLSQDRGFIEVFLEQLAFAGLQLEDLAVSLGVSPLELTLEDLISAKLDSASN